VQIPFRDRDGGLIGLVDLIDGSALRFADDGSGQFSPEPLPDWLEPEVAAARERLAEAVAMTDDQLLEEYLEYLTLPTHTLRAALVAAVQRRQLVPVLMTSAERRIGARSVLDAMVAWTPPYGAIPRRVIDEDGARTPVDPRGRFLAQVLSEHRDEDGDGWHLIRLLAGAPPRADWVDGSTGAVHRIRKTYRVRGPRRATAPCLVPGAIVATWDPLPVAAGGALTDGPRRTLALPPPRLPMMALAIRPVRERDQDKVDEALAAVIRGDRGLASRRQGGLVLLAGQDEAHVRRAIERVRRWSGGVEVACDLPPVGYVETPTARVSGIEGLHVHKDHSGMVEEFGRCELTLAPTDPDAGARFVDEMGDQEEDLPLKYRSAVDEGARAAVRHGPTAGYPVVGVELRLTGGEYDILQSTEDHFRQAGEKGARIALERAGTRVLEPWCEVEVTVPNHALGDLLSDIAAHRGRVVGMSIDGDRAVLQAHCPYRELRTFSSRLRTLASGRGEFRSELSHYEPLPDHLLPEAIEASPHRREARPPRAAGR
jgi:elongation factor G